MNPYDADAALEAIRPRLAAARVRRRRSVGASAAVAMLAVSSVAYAAVLTPSDPGHTVVATDDTDAGGPTAMSLADSRSDDPDGAGAGGDVAPAPPPPVEPALEATSDEAPSVPAIDPAEPEPPAASPPPAPAKDPTTTTQAPKPTTTSTAPPQAQTLTFTYPDTGSVTVTQTGATLAFVSATAEPGWSYQLTHQAADLVGVEFTKDNVQRWLKVKVVDGVAVASLHEQVKCVPPPGTSTHQAPSGAGSMTVQVDGSGRLSFVSADPAPGWNHQVIADRPDLVKVGFWGDEGDVWVLVKVHDCTLRVESG